jgi:kinesin family member 1
LLNRVTPAKDWIYLTITCYISIDNCIQPACITKDLSLIFYARDSKPGGLPRSLRNLIYGPVYESIDANSVSGIYHLTIKQAADTNSPASRRRAGHSRRIIDSTSSYVRGEEMLDGWRPRSDSLIFEHQWELEKLSRLQHVEKTKHFLLLKETVDSLKKDEDEKLNENSVEIDKNEKVDNISEQKEPPPPQELTNEETNDGDKSFSSSSTSLASSGSIMSTYDENERELLLKCINLINQGRLCISRDNKTTPPLSTSRSMYDGLTNSTSFYNLKQNIPNINVNNF